MCKYILSSNDTVQYEENSTVLSRMPRRGRRKDELGALKLNRYKKKKEK